MLNILRNSVLIACAFTVGVNEILEISLIITDTQDFNELCSLENQVENISIRNVEPSPKGGLLTIVVQK